MYNSSPTTFSSTSHYYPFGMPMPMRSYSWYGGGKWLVLNRMLVSGESVTAVIDGNTETLCTYNSSYTDIDDYYTAITSALSSLGITATVDGDKLQLSGWNNDDALVSENDLVAIESNSNYRYGFNGQEKDNQVSGFGNSYAAEFWLYDPRLGRRWNMDPIIKEWESPYLAFAGNPIFLVDTKGDDAKPPTKYIDEDGHELANTNDGSDDVITIPDSRLNEFLENVGWTPQEMQNSAGWNGYWKTEVLGFETTGEMENTLGLMSSQWSRQQFINAIQDPSAENILKFYGTEALVQNLNPINHLPMPIEVKGGGKGPAPKTTVTTKVETKIAPKSAATTNVTTKVETKVKAQTSSTNPWIEFNREMGPGKFTKEKYGSSEAAIQARREAYKQWKTQKGQ